MLHAFSFSESDQAWDDLSFSSPRATACSYRAMAVNHARKTIAFAPQPPTLPSSCLQMALQTVGYSMGGRSPTAGTRLP